MLKKISDIKKKLGHINHVNEIIMCSKELENIMYADKEDKYKNIVTVDLIRCYATLSEFFIKNANNPLAIEYVNKAISLKEDHTLYNNLGYMQLSNNNYSESIKAYLKCIKLKPDFNLAYHGLIQNYKQTNNKEKELEYIDKGLKLCPKDGEFYNFKGVFLFEINDITNCLATFKKGLEVSKDPKVTSKLCMNIGHVKSTIGDPHEAIKDYLEALNIDDEHILSYENVLLNINYFKQVPKYVTDHMYKRNHCGRQKFPVNGTIQDYHLFVSKILYPEIKYQNIKPRPHKFEDKRKVIGYVSGDLIDHAVSFFTEVLFKHYDPKKFKVFIYSTHYYPDIIINQIGSNIHYRHIQNLSMENIINQVYADNIDILIDLSGYTNGNKLDLFGSLSNIQRQATQHHNGNSYSKGPKGPKLLSFLGYPANTGIENMARITDEYTEVAGNEKEMDLVKLPRLFLCFSPKINGSINITKKFIQGYENHVVLGSFAKLQKINQEVIDLWTLILEKFKQRNIKCVLIIKNKYFSDKLVRDEWVKKFDKNVDIENDIIENDIIENGTIENKEKVKEPILREDVILLNGSATYNEHMEMYNLLDVQLDTWPYSGTTITCESLFMNVPVVAYCQKTNSHVSRVSGSIINAMTKENNIFKDFTVDNKEDYINRVFELYEKGRNRTLPIHNTFMTVMEPKRYMSEYEGVLDKL